MYVYVIALLYNFSLAFVLLRQSGMEICTSFWFIVMICYIIAANVHIQPEMPQINTHMPNLVSKM